VYLLIRSEGQQQTYSLHHRKRDNRKQQAVSHGLPPDTIMKCLQVVLCSTK
jgi:hypothetical protein